MGRSEGAGGGDARDARIARLVWSWKGDPFGFRPGPVIPQGGHGSRMNPAIHSSGRPPTAPSPRGGKEVGMERSGKRKFAARAVMVAATALAVAGAGLAQSAQAIPPEIARLQLSPNTGAVGAS